MYSSQIACADVILINKSDLVKPAELDDLQKLVETVNPAASIYRTTRGSIELKLMMGIDAYSSRQALPNNFVASHSHSESCDSHDHEHIREPRHYEVRGISSLQVSCPILSPSKLQEVDEWIRTVLWENKLPDDSDADSPRIEVLRCKGIFRTTNGETYVLQGVRSLYELNPVPDPQSADMGLPDEGKLVFIGKGLEKQVRRSLEILLSGAIV